MDKISTSEKGRIPGKEGVMGEVIKVLDWLLENLVQICTVMLELFGIIVLVSTAVSCFVQWIRNKRQLIRLNLAQGIALALEFKHGRLRCSGQLWYGSGRNLEFWEPFHCPSGNAYIFDSLGDQERKKRNPGRARRKARVKKGARKKGVCG